MSGILKTLPNPVKIISNTLPSSICAARIFTEIFKREMIQYELTFLKIKLTHEIKDDSCTINDDRLKDGDILIDMNGDGVLLRERSVLQDVTNVSNRVNNEDMNNIEDLTKRVNYTNHKNKGVFTNIETSCETYYKSTQIAYDLAKSINFLPENITWIHTVITRSTEEFECVKHFPFLNDSNLMKSFSQLTTKKRLCTTLAMLGVSIIHAETPYNLLSVDIKQRAEPLFTNKTFIKSYSLFKNLISDASKESVLVDYFKMVGSKAIYSTEQYFTMLHYLNINKPFDAFLSLTEYDISGRKIFLNFIEKGRSLRLKMGIGFGVYNNEGDLFWVAVLQLTGLRGIILRKGTKKLVVRNDGIEEIEKDEVSRYLRTQLIK